MVYLEQDCKCSIENVRLVRMEWADVIKAATLIFGSLVTVGALLNWHIDICD